MTWVLIGLQVMAQTTAGLELGRYPDLDTCFKAREVIIGGAEFPPTNTQFVCVQYKGEGV